MKRFALAIILACCALSLAAQGVIRVNYQGDRPNISDFVSAYLTGMQDISVEDEDECCIDEATHAFAENWKLYKAGKKLDEGNAITVDLKNGFVVYESKYDNHLLRIEACFWNESDGKHRLFAFNVRSYSDGKASLGQYDGMSFFRYDNAAKTMSRTDDVGFEQEYYANGCIVTYSLPRSGKDITVTYWNEDNGNKTEKTLKWGGRRFSF